MTAISTSRRRTAATNNASILFGNGDGTLQPAQVYTINGTGVGSSLGDLDGDG